MLAGRLLGPRRPSAAAVPRDVSVRMGVLEIVEQLHGVVDGAMDVVVQPAFYTVASILALSLLGALWNRMRPFRGTTKNTLLRGGGAFLTLANEGKKVNLGEEKLSLLRHNSLTSRYRKKNS